MPAIATPRAPAKATFASLMVSELFAGKSRLARHRLVNEALADELKGKIHALALELHAPGEDVK